MFTTAPLFDFMLGTSLYPYRSQKLYNLYKTLLSVQWLEVCGNKTNAIIIHVCILINTLEPLYKDPPEIQTSPLVRTLSVVPTTWKSVQKYSRNEDTSFNQDTFNCPKGVRNREIPPYHQSFWLTHTHIIQEPPSSQGSIAEATPTAPAASSVRKSYDQLAAERTAKIVRLKAQKEMENKVEVICTIIAIYQTLGQDAKNARIEPKSILAFHNDQLCVWLYMQFW